MRIARREQALKPLVGALAVLVLAALVVGTVMVWQRSFLPIGTAPPVPEVIQGGPTITSPRDARPGDEEAEPLAEARRRMVENDLGGRDITDKRVLEVMGRVRRQDFVPETLKRMAYSDQPLPIGHGQTISQPYIVALMTQLARPNPTSRVLDVGTGSGYQAAVLAELCKEVYSIEILQPLADEASKRLTELGYENVTVRCGDGYRGWPEHGPFDAIIVAAAPDHVPQPLVDQLARGGRLVIPVGRFFQDLILVEKRADGSVHQETVTGVAFVPMRGEAERGPAP